MGNLAKMAQQMQADMARVQQELEDLHVEGELVDRVTAPGVRSRT